MSTPWNCTPAWMDLPPEPRAILWGIAEELWALGYTATPDHISSQMIPISGVATTETPIADMLRIAMNGKSVQLVLRGGEVTLHPVGPRQSFLTVEAVATVPLADPDSIPQIIEKVKELAGIKATSGN